MFNRNNNDSSSSDDDISQDALKEATDHQFLKDSYFFNAKSEGTNISEKSNKYNDTIQNNEATTNVVSLRKNLEQVDKFSNFGVSPSFQNYVAKKLDEIIEKSIRVKKTEANNVANEGETASTSFGVKLLSSSVEFLTAEEEIEESAKSQKSRKKRKVETTVDDKTNLSRCKEVAVDPELILSRKETKAWTSKRKEPEFRYKRLKNGTFVEATCNARPRLYTCPKCDVEYCSVDCYKSEAHLECSEGFYKQCIEEELKSQEGDPEGRQKMIEILRRVHDEDVRNMEALASEDMIEEEAEDSEHFDSDDDEDVQDLERRLHDVNLDNADEVWSALTDTEKQEFEALIKNGDIEKLLPQWVPWWTYHTKKKLVEEMNGKENNDEQRKELPALVDVPIFNELQKASPNVQFNVLNVIYAYAYIANYYNGDYLNCPLEATIVFLDLCDNMKANKIYDNSESAITSVVHKILDCNWLPQDEQTLSGFEEAGNTIMQGPEKRNKYMYVAVALSELHRLLAAAKEDIPKSKSKDGKKEFSKKFAKRYNMDDINLSKKTLLMYRKKVEYYLSWTKSCHINTCT